MEKLKPCPFCGYNSPKITEKRSGNNRRTGDMFQVLCGKCKARGPIFTAAYIREGDFGRYRYKSDHAARNEAMQNATQAWNRRTAETDTPCGAWKACWDSIKEAQKGADNENA